jgi:hypothetical protein
VKPFTIAATLLAIAIAIAVLALGWQVGCYVAKRGPVTMLVDGAFTVFQRLEETR